MVKGLPSQRTSICLGLQLMWQAQFAFACVDSVACIVLAAGKESPRQLLQLTIRHASTVVGTNLCVLSTSLACG
jgi:hypothetical protein